MEKKWEQNTEYSVKNELVYNWIEKEKWSFQDSQKDSILALECNFFESSGSLWLSLLLMYLKCEEFLISGLEKER